MGSALLPISFLSASVFTVTFPSYMTQPFCRSLCQVEWSSSFREVRSACMNVTRWILRSLFRIDLCQPMTLSTLISSGAAFIINGCAEPSM